MTGAYISNSNLRHRTNADGTAEVVIILEQTPEKPISRELANWSICSSEFHDPEGILPSEPCIQLILQSQVAEELNELVEITERLKGSADRYAYSHLRRALDKLTKWGKGKVNSIEIVGAIGELHLLELLLIYCDGDVEKMRVVFDGWQKFEMTTFDFIINGVLIEVKTTTSAVSRDHMFQSPQQANPPNNCEAYVASIGIKRESMTTPNSRSVTEMIQSIRSLLMPGLDVESPEAYDDLLADFNEAVENSEILNHSDAAVKYSMSTNLPLRFTLYQDVPGIEAIREHYDGIVWKGVTWNLDNAAGSAFEGIAGRLFEDHEEEA